MTPGVIYHFTYGNRVKLHSQRHFEGVATGSTLRAKLQYLHHVDR